MAAVERSRIALLATCNQKGGVSIPVSGPSAPPRSTEPATTLAVTAPVCTVSVSSRDDDDGRSVGEIEHRPFKHARRDRSEARAHADETSDADFTPEVTRAIARGDMQMFAAFYDDWFDRIAAYCGRVTRRDESFCLDIVHDVMLKVIHRMRVLPNARALSAWMRRTTLRCAFDRLREESRRAQRELAAPHSSNGQMTHSHEIHEQLDRVRQAMSHLGEDDAELLHLRHRLGWTLRRIGMRLGLSAGAVDSRLRRITLQLREECAEKGDRHA